MALKDLVLQAGRPATAGSRILEGFIAPYDSQIAERLDAAGAVVRGQDEHGRVRDGLLDGALRVRADRQPLGPRTRVPGGSSGGSAVAVAASHVPLAIGTDTGGSIRQPAAMTGTVGLKPTYGRVSRYGIVAFASSLDQIGPFGAGRPRCGPAAGHGRRPRRPRRDLVAARGPRLRGGAARTATTRRPARSGACVSACPASTSSRAWSRASRRSSERPSRTSRPREPRSWTSTCPTRDYGLATYYIIAPAEASANLARYDGVRYGLSVRGGDVLADYLATRAQGFGAEVKRRIMLGTYALSAGYYDAFYVKAQKVRTLIKADYDRAFETVDAIVGPTSPTVAFPLGARLDDPVAMYLADACTLPVNMAGLPGMSIPCGLADGLPVGLQLIGRAWDESRILRLGRAYEAVTAAAAWREVEPTDLPSVVRRG